MAFLGKEYKYESQENFEEFLKATGVPDDRVQDVAGSRPSFTIVQDGDTYTINTTGFRGAKTVSFKSGDAIESVVGSDRTITTTYTVEGNTLTEVVQGRTSLTTFKKEFNGDELVETVTSNKWDGVASRYYKA